MIDPIAFEIGPLRVHWYGIIIASAVLIAGLLGSAEARRRGEDPERGWSMLLLVIVMAVIGARVYHVAHEWEHYSQRPDLIPQIWTGGVGMPGVIIGGVAAIWLYTRLNGWSTARWLDIYAPALLLGQAIGRLGNFVNQELYGPPTDLPWGIPIDAQHRVAEWANLAEYPVETTRFHPLFAYEAGLNVIGVVLLLWIARRWAHRLYDGDVLLMYLIWYGSVRTVLETLRVDNWVIAGIPTAMILGTTAAVLAAAFLFLRHRRGWGTPSRTDATPGEPQATDAEPQPG